MKDLFGNDVILPPNGDRSERLAVRQYKQLIATYGKFKEKTCRQCIFCEHRAAGSKKFYKCIKASVSHSAATDWNSRWVACGLFKRDEITDPTNAFYHD